MASASKQGHESLESYVDNLKVKISERYKPPPRINTIVTYAQRLTLNKHIQDNMPNYEFVLEKTVLEKMREWKSVRKSTFEERKTKVEQLKSELKQKQIESDEQRKLDEMEVKTVDNTVATPKTNYNSNQTDIVFASSSINHQNYTNYTTSDILMPTQVTTNYSNILTPIPLTKSVNQQFSCKPVDKSPFNLSDFENDTSSPFDNMELKSINDMEELAQVLKSEEGKYKPNINTPLYQNYQAPPNQPTSVGGIQPNIPSYVGYTYSIPDTVSYIQPVISDYSRTNGYYYSPDIVKQNESYSSSYLYSKPTNATYNQVSQSSVFTESKKSSCKSVPDIMKSLEIELENSHLDNFPNTSQMREYVGPQTSRPKSTEAVIYPRTEEKEDELGNPFSSLPKAQQDLCKSIGSMGFPLSRVARACKAVGNDHKKIVEHLLALSDLLDLGFEERAVSEALLECDNDRDKALDKLVS